MLLIFYFHRIHFSVSEFLLSKKRLEDLEPVLEARVDELQRKLSDVEYASSSMSQELASLNAAVQKMLPENRTNSVLSLTSIYSYLPHLVTLPNGLSPKIHVASKRRRKGLLRSFSFFHLYCCTENPQQSSRFV